MCFIYTSVVFYIMQLVFLRPVLTPGLLYPGIKPFVNPKQRKQNVTAGQNSRKLCIIHKKNARYLYILSYFSISLYIQSFCNVETTITLQSTYSLCSDESDYIRITKLMYSPKFTVIHNLYTYSFRGILWQQIVQNTTYISRETRIDIPTSLLSVECSTNYLNSQPRLNFIVTKLHVLHITFTYFRLVYC